MDFPPQAWWSAIIYRPLPPPSLRRKNVLQVRVGGPTFALAKGLSAQGRVAFPRLPWCLAPIRLSISPRRPKSHTASATVADGPFTDQLDAGGVERRNQLHQRVDCSPNDILARLHPLDRRHGEP